MNLFKNKNREPLTPAQTKVAAGAACIALIVSASVAFDLLIGGSASVPANEDAVAQQQTVAPDPDQGYTSHEEALPSDEAAEAVPSETPSEEGAASAAKLGTGESLDAGDLVLFNGSARTAGEESSALVGDLRAFLVASGLDFDGSTFTIASLASNPETGEATYFLTSGVEGARYVQASRASASEGFQVSTVADEAAFNALMEKSAAGPAEGEGAAAGAQEGGDQNG